MWPFDPIITHIVLFLNLESQGFNYLKLNNDRLYRKEFLPVPFKKRYSILSFGSF